MMATTGTPLHGQCLCVWNDAADVRSFGADSRSLGECTSSNDVPLTAETGRAGGTGVQQVRGPGDVVDKEIGAKNIENVVCGWYSCTGHANHDGDHELTAPPEIAHVSHSSDITC